MKDYQVNYIDNSGKETNYCTLAADIKTATEKLNDCKKIVSVTCEYPITHDMTEKELSAIYQNRAYEG